MTYCTKCGKQNPDTAKFCTGCGGGLTTNMQPVVSKKKTFQWVIIGIITLAALVAGSWFIFFNKVENKNTSSSAETTVTSDEAIKLKDLVHQWSAGLNKGNAVEVSTLYAERLVYYRSQMSKGNATVLLSDFFLKNSDFYQQITGEIMLEKVNDNLIVANFQKTVTRNGKTTGFPSYLKFSDELGGWKIVEEGDKITDYNINKKK